MIYETYCKICKKHNVKPTQVIADGNIAEILNNDQGKHLEYHETLLDEYLKVYYHKGRPAQWTTRNFYLKKDLNLILNF